jgi:protein TonB
LNIIRQNPNLFAAVAISVLGHATVLLGVMIVAPDAFKFQPTDPGLEVILVNAKHDRKPIKAEALAQVDLDGGGNADTGRAKSPLPDMHKSDDGDDIKVAQRRIEQLEQEQEKMLAQAANKTQFAVRPNTEQDKPTEQPVRPDGVDKVDSAKAFSRQVAEISKNVEDYNKRPRKTQITPSTKRVEYALYYKAMQTRIEKYGTLNFPQKDGEKLYGELLVYIPIFQDGSIYEKEGGPRVEHSSGNKALDNAALRIVRRAAPFDPFQSSMRSTDKNDVWEVITHFKFTREEGLETELRGGAN